MATEQERTEHAQRVLEREQADRDQRAGWKDRGLMRPTTPKKKGR